MARLLIELEVIVDPTRVDPEDVADEVVFSDDHSSYWISYSPSVVMARWED